MLYVESDGTIKLTRGDTARLTVDIDNDVDGNEYIIQEEDTLTMTIKKNITDTVPALQKISKGVNVFHIQPSDTSQLDFGSYKYDIQLMTADGDVYTVIGPATFTLLKEVTC